MPYTFVDYRGEVKQDEVGTFATVVVGEKATGDPDVVRVFADDTEFRKWSETAPVAEQVDKVLRERERDVLPLRADESFIERMQQMALKRTKASFKAFADLLERDVRDEEVIRQAMTERTALTPSIFDPMLLYDRRIEVEPPQGSPVDPRTQLLPVPSGWWPSLSWVGWDNRPRSARVFGLNVLSENDWFGGRSAWLFGFNMLLNLDHLAFDRITSSICAQ
jgi:hypothetical protein